MLQGFEAGCRRATSLPHSPLFAQLDAKALDDIRRHTRPRRYASGDVICQEGDRGDSVLVLQRGCADVHVTSRAERRAVTLRHLRAGHAHAVAGVPQALEHLDRLEIAHETVILVVGADGSSFGAIIAVWLALGMSGADIADTLTKRWAPQPVVDEIFRKGAAGDGGRILGELLRERTRDRSFADLETPATVMTADLTARCPAPLTSGGLWEALMAAVAIPGLYPPWLRGEQRLVDAVSLTPVPIESAIEAGADVTIAVNVLGRESRPAWPATAAGAEGAAALATRRRGHVRDTVVEVLELAQLDASARQAARADVPITPQFGPGTWRDMQLGPLFSGPEPRQRRRSSPAWAPWPGHVKCWPDRGSGTGGLATCCRAAATSRSAGS